MQGTQLLKRAVQCSASRIATISGDRQRTWREVGERVPRMAAALRSLGVQDGAFVAILAMNCDRYLELFFAVPWAGGALAPLNVRWSAVENVYALTDSNAEVLFVDDSFLEQVDFLRAERPGIRHFIYLGDGPTPAGMLSYEDLVAQHAPMPDADRKEDDLYVIFYTGGTTAHPKGVAMSHRGVYLATCCYLALLPSVEDLTFLYVAGYFHFAGASALWYITMAAGTHAILPKFEALPVMKAIGQHRVTNAVLVPTMVNMLLSHPDFKQYDLSSLKTCIYGGSPMPEGLMLRAMEMVPTWGFYQIYGMTETGGFATMLRWRDHIVSGEKASRLRSAGQAGFGNEVRVVRIEGDDADVGEIGEIIVRSDFLMTGYLNNPEATAACLRDGWMHTGDAGYLDADGFLYVADRVKDMIVSGGENVYSIEPERALFLHKAVREAAVIGIPSEQWGEAVHAVVVLKDGASATAEELIAHCRTLIGGYKCPRSIEFRADPLPVTPVGKVRKNVLRDPYWAGHERKI
ncbi:long-chain acyl-CoA synthetase [Variovorax sp. OK605]|jgi:long-chain acyl-CoA synthetase|uniref:long-chain-fatty-acid--CoA ligase n=1 Tax=Variovorax sp. OK605 TaxID=1855317 RepID=UPI0008E5463A|nr:long-chain-fatty-acid--CoA ligase [Variovorax sp. OK605]SFP56132.1 long-chain acyl-CoA synthetase [Variovorax sp. OK605]